MHTFYQPSGLDKSDTSGKSQTHETVKSAPEQSQTNRSGRLVAQGKEGGKKRKAASQQQQLCKSDLEGDLLQGGVGHLLGEGGGPSQPVEDGSSGTLESEGQTEE